MTRRGRGFLRRTRATVLPLVALAVLCHGLSGHAATAGAQSVSQEVTRDQAARIALQALPGKVTDLTIERKRGQNVYVVEIVAEKDGAETDVLVDPRSGKVLGME
jgi:uncharacterized membrane protein YkoI